MPTIEASPFLSARIPDRVTTRAEVETQVTRHSGRDQLVREGWQSVIDRRLIEWGRTPGQFEDEGVDPPNLVTIQRAISLAMELRDAGFPPPDTVVSDPNGGVVFESRSGNIREMFHIWDDGTVEYVQFERTRLVRRRRLL